MAREFLDSKGVPLPEGRIAPKVATKKQLHEAIRATWPCVREKFDKMIKEEYGDFLVDEAELSHKGEWVLQQRGQGPLVRIKFTVAIESMVTVIADRLENQN